MGKKITVDKLGDEIEKILENYSDNLNRNIKEVQKKCASKGAAALRNESKSTFNGTGKYAKGWTSTQKKGGKHYNTSTIFNKNEPTLTHLLEYGHALVRGGRTIGHVQGRAHIAPVEEELNKQYLEQVVSVIRETSV